MTKQEFHEFLRRVPGHEQDNVSAEDYARVEYVYTWHPSIPNVGGKEAIAHIYAYGGMCVIEDMYARAKRAEQADAEVRAIRQDMKAVEEKHRAYIAEAEKRIAQLMAEVCA